jgi:hypothetical protein
MAPHPGMHVLCPACEGPIPDLLGELTDEAAAIISGTRTVECYYCGVALLCPGFGVLILGSAIPPPARRTALRRDLKFGDANGVNAWVTGVEQALQDEANNALRDPSLPSITRTKLVNKLGRRAFEGYQWA